MALNFNSYFGWCCCSSKEDAQLHTINLSRPALEDNGPSYVEDAYGDPQDAYAVAYADAQGTVPSEIEPEVSSELTSQPPEEATTLPATILQVLSEETQTGSSLSAKSKPMLSKGKPILDLKSKPILDLPLSHYFINSSHNTYLLGDQLAGEVSPEGAAIALRRGCRVVELDLYDGESHGLTGPCVMHGGTATKPALLKPCLEAIRDSAFEASEAPVIITLENHTNKEGQRQVATLLRSVFGDSLYVPREPCTPTEWPIPDQLLRRIIIRDKPQRIEESDSAKASKSTTASHILGMARSFKSSKSKNISVQHEAGQELKTKEGFQMSCQMRLVSVQDDELRQLVSLGILKTKDIEDMSALELHTTSSFGDTDFNSMLHKKGINAWRQYTNDHIARIYPPGYHIDSSNYDPQDPWEAGCQIVAINFQGSALSHSRTLWLNAGKFRANCGCGYVPKPPHLLGTGLPRSAELTVTVSGGNGWDAFRNKDLLTAPDSYVEVQIAGAKQDRCTKQTQVFKTHTTRGPAAQPVWNAQFKFSVSDVDLAVLVLVAWDDDLGKDDLLGQNAFPVAELATGPQKVPLLANDGDLQKGDPTLVCDFQVTYAK